MSNFGDLVLVLGDLHIPDRAVKIPEQFNRMLNIGKLKYILSTGNVGQYDLLSLHAELYAVAGDASELDSPEHQVLTIGDFRIGIIHGHQLLPHQHDALVRKLRVDILVTGATHQSCVEQKEGYYHLNPGSITGAMHPKLDTVVPSFILLGVQEGKLTCYVYELIEGNVEVTKTEIVKEDKQESKNTELLTSLLQ